MLTVVSVYLAKSIDIRSYCVRRTDQVQGTPLPGCNKTPALLEDSFPLSFLTLGIIWVVIVQNTLTSVYPESSRYQERATERVLECNNRQYYVESYNIYLSLNSLH